MWIFFKTKREDAREIKAIAKRYKESESKYEHIMYCNIAHL